jgi:hypothetical protein
MKLYEAGVRYFKGVDASRVYHFGSKSTHRIILNNGSKQFLNKWGITSATFARFYLKRGQNFEGEVIKNPGNPALRKALLKGKIKRILWLFNGTGKTKGKYSINNADSDNS